MEQITKLKKMKRSNSSHPVSYPSKGYLENCLTPIGVPGVVAPWSQKFGDDRGSEYEIVSHSGLEYFIVADNEWRDVLSKYCWEEVKVIGLLNAANMTLIPQKIYPKWPKGENVIDLFAWRSKEFVKKLVKNVNDLVVIPAALWAVVAF